MCVAIIKLSQLDTFYIMEQRTSFPGIYVIVNRINDKLYIGESGNVGVRLRGHRSRLRAGEHEVAPMQKDFEQMGEAAFDFRVLEVGFSNARQRKYREGALIGLMASDDSRYGYNQTRGGRWSDEARQRDSERKYIKKWGFELLPGISLYDPMLPEYLESCMRARENWRRWYEAARRWTEE